VEVTDQPDPNRRFFDQLILHPGSLACQVPETAGPVTGQSSRTQAAPSTLFVRQPDTTRIRRIALPLTAVSDLGTWEDLSAVRSIGPSSSLSVAGAPGRDGSDSSVPAPVRFRAERWRERLLEQAL